MPKPRVEVKVPPVAPQPPPTKAQPPPPAVTASAAAPAPAPPKAKPAQPKTKKAKPAAPPSTSYPDEEVIEFGKPAKRARPSPPQQPPPAPTPAAPVSLSLPGGSTPSFAPPPAPVSSKPSASTSRNVPAPAPPLAVAPSSPQMVQSDSSDDEEDWEQVPTATPVISQPQPDYELALEEDIFGDGFADADAEGGEEIDVNAFEQELNEQMGESDDDFLAAAVSPEPEQQQTRQPISLNRLASGADAADSEDDYTSSEDSDED
ncbi:hypothetical protein BDZ97DRAFT_687369 [Flammula alnicola]|nr:hypothetical protein BDZ97DRAFT_687369 [Flammula alnicola]